MGHFATGVTIVTATDNGEPVGMACNSFTSVSLDPPLVLYCAAKDSTTWPRLHNAGHFAVNVLDEDGEAVCRVFATKGVDRFVDVTHHRGATGAPILADAIAYIDCETETEHDAGDHVIVVGRVVELGYASEGKPLLFYRGGYGHFES
ncbi:MAG: 3-hydroxy-9,10-secoandrosta,3,5(10)-triene-9,17-dione monooxygenase reductase component [Actinomycetota bacterium]|nr:3-hydroxy-9,10-secoandrosta,3,5(10)-triene-9,17-dione monooxygenase reductase component [Actinomycetota bacterium]